MSSPLDRDPSQPGSLKRFRRRSALAIQDERLQGALEGATARFRDSRAEALAAYPGAEDLRDRFKQRRQATLAQLELHLDTFENNARAAGAVVHRADSPAEARQIVVDIARSHGVRLAAKSKSMVTEEIHLNRSLQDAGIQPVETDLGEFIIQLADEPPFHILAPAIHKTRGQVAQLFSRETGQQIEADDIPRLTAEARRLLRGQFLDAGMGITGVNIGVAQTGSIVLVTNEGNGEMVTALPPVHVAIMGVEKIAPDWDDAALWLALLARSATGQPLSIYTTAITGPAKPADPDGPGELHIIVLDGGRKKLLGSRYEEVLQCIRCGACLNVCPVYREAGGHAYGSPYSGPIGAVVSPLLFGLQDYAGLPQASSLCGACLDVCPARIDLPRMLLELRADEVQNRLIPWPERTAERLVARLFGRQRLFSFSTRILRTLQRPFLRHNQLRLPGRLNPAPGRQLPHLAVKPFRDIWPELESEQAEQVTHSPTPHQEAELPNKPGASPPDPADHAPDPSPQSLVNTFNQALTASGGEVILADSLDQALDKVAALLEDMGARQGIANNQPPFDALDLAALCPNIAWRIAAEKNNGGFRTFSAEADIGLSTAEAALAETGTVVVATGPGLSRFTALLPPVHLVLAPASCLVGDIFEWAASCQGQLPAAVTLISGPSKTADIEQTLAIGVHGPKRFIAILYDDE